MCLVTDNLPLVWLNMSKLRLGGDDYYQIGCIGLIKAAETFQDDKGYTFSTYASKCIVNEILRNVKRENRAKREADKTSTSYDAWEDDYLSNILNQDDDFVDDMLNKMVLTRVFNSLTEREARILRLKYYDNLTNQEIGEIEGVHRERVRQILNDCYRKGREVLSGGRKAV